MVFALEHKDGSSCASYHPTNPVPYNYPDLSKLLADQSEDNFLLKFRQNQRDIKVREVKELVHIIELLNLKGVESIGLLVKNIMNKKMIEILKSLKGKLDLSNLFMMGHSFGVSNFNQFLMIINNQGCILFVSDTRV